MILHPFQQYFSRMVEKISPPVGLELGTAGSAGQCFKHAGRIRIGGRNITNLLYAVDIDLLYLRKNSAQLEALDENSRQNLNKV